MAKQVWKAGNMVYPLPAVMVSTADKEGKYEHFYRCMDRNCMYKSGDGIHFRKTGKIFVSYD